MVPVPTFEKFRFRFRFQLHIKTIKSKSCFTRKKFYNVNKFIENVNEKMLNEGNQTHNFISSSGSGTVIIYGSGYDF
jgi:hypothetical protein